MISTLQQRLQHHKNRKKIYLSLVFLCVAGLYFIFLLVSENARKNENLKQVEFYKRNQTILLSILSKYDSIPDKTILKNTIGKHISYWQAVASNNENLFKEFNQYYTHSLLRGIFTPQPWKRGGDFLLILLVEKQMSNEEYKTIHEWISLAVRRHYTIITAKSKQLPKEYQKQFKNRLTDIDKAFNDANLQKTQVLIQSMENYLRSMTDILALQHELNILWREILSKTNQRPHRDMKRNFYIATKAVETGNIILFKEILQKLKMYR